MASAFWVPKQGNDAHEWEDGFALSERSGRFAVSDGASTSAWAREWAAALTGGYISEPFDLLQRNALPGWLARRHEQFAASRPDPSTTEGAWYASEVATRDAFATLLLVDLAEEFGHARCTAVGDSNLFVIDRSGALRGSWPLQNAADFNSTPALVSSNPEHLPQAVAAVQRCRIALESGFGLLLCTDALAEWALGVASSEPEVWPVLRSIGEQDFRRLIADLRSHGELVNDDVTMLRVHVDPGRQS